MKTFNIIALCGYKSSGKDFVANYITKKYNYRHEKISKKLKNTIQMLFDLTDDQIEGTQKEMIDEKWGVSPRKLMQFIGTDVFQYKLPEILPDCNRTFWIKSMCNEIKEKKCENIVISDLRFVHEYEYFKEHMVNYNIVIVEIVNNKIFKNDTHISESEFDMIPKDYVVNNELNDNICKEIDAILNVYDNKTL